MNKKLSTISYIMLLSTFICNLFYSTTYPYIYSVVIKSITDTYISIDQILYCIGIILIGHIWNNYGDRIFKYYKIMLIIESITQILLGVFIITTGQLKIYYILNSIIISFITRNLNCGFIKMQAKAHPTDVSREYFDNTNNSCYAIATLLGSILSIVLTLEFNITIIISLLGDVIDNILTCYIYEKLSKEHP